MKKYLFLATVAFTFMACTDESQSIIPDSNEALNLAKVEKFIYRDNGVSLDLKKVMLFENGAIVSDSLFDGDNNYVGRVVHTMDGSTYTQESYTMIGDIDELVNTTVYKYDSSGRLIEATGEATLLGSGFKRDITYNDDNTISVVVSDIPSGEELYTNVYTLNDNGLINSVVFGNMDPMPTCTLTFDGDKPVQSVTEYPMGDDTITYSYYSNAVPANIAKTAIQINNGILENAEPYNLRGAAIGCNYFLQSETYADGTSNTYAKTFNTEGYITPDIATMNGLYEEHTFYYYNE